MSTRARPLHLALLLVAGLAAFAGPVAATERVVGDAAVPPAARPVDTSKPDRYIGNGTPRSCTSRRVVQAVAPSGTEGPWAVAPRMAVVRSSSGAVA